MSVLQTILLIHSWLYYLFTNFRYQIAWLGVQPSYLIETDRMHKIYYMLFFLTFFLCSSSFVDGQIRLFQRRSQEERATRDLEKRRKPTAQFNPFNPLQEMGSSNIYLRDDYIWSPETAYISFYTREMWVY